METKKTGLNSNQIKLIAIIAMTIDHLVWTIFPGTQHTVPLGTYLKRQPLYFFICEACVIQY